MKNISKLLLCVISLSVFSVGNTEEIVMDSENWLFEGEVFKFEEYKGKDAIFLKDATAWLKGQSFKNGVIEYDIAIPEEWSFHYFYLRGESTENFEEFYLRSSQSNRDDAIQYSPVYNGISGWQLYTGDNYNANVAFRFNEWMHVKLVVKDSRMDVYLNSEKPVLQVRLRREGNAGSVGFGSTIEGAYYANLTILESDLVNITDLEPQAKTPSDNIISDWKISNTFPENYLQPDLQSNINQTLRWTPIKPEETGVINLAKYVKPEFNCEANSRCGDTVMVKTIISSQSKTFQKISFGYSDRASVYVNGKLIYSGTTEFRSRDFRYLGTIGLFDVLYVQLEAGKNEITFAVSETFGGWGLIARLDND